MAKKQLKLDEQAFEFNFTVLAIVSQSRDYHLCWQINRELSLDLRRDNDLRVDDSKKQQISYFSFFSFNDDANLNKYYLIANKSGNQVYMPEAKVADFLLVLNKRTNEEINAIMATLKKLPQVIAVTNLEVDKLKSKKNLIFD